MTTVARWLGGVRRAWRGVSAIVAVPAMASCLALGAGSAGLAGLAPSAGPAGPAGSARSGSNAWMGSAGTSPSMTLRDVRAAINASTGTAASLTGSGVGVALVDTGVAPAPGVPAAQLVNGPDLSFESQSSNLRYLDTYGHGTHMAGIVIANDPSSKTVGLAPKARLTSVKVAVSNGSVDVSQVIMAIDWVVEHRNDDPAYPIRVLNLSYGTGGTADYRSDPIQFAIEQAWRAGIVVVVASGNDGNATGSLTDPATDPFVIAVGASDAKGTVSTDDDVLAPYTNLSTRGRTVDLLAPGESIVSLRDAGSQIDMTYPSARVADSLFRGSGTSQAAAVTSAAAALLIQHRPSLTPDQVKRLMVDSASPLVADPGAKLGLRQLNVGAAIARPVPTTSQSWPRSTGTGLIETSRGDEHVVLDGTPLRGERTIVGSFSSSTWAAAAASHNAWSGGDWMGKRLAGDGWTGAGGDTASGQIGGPGGYCLDVRGEHWENGTDAILWYCMGRSNQLWEMADDGTVRTYGKCLDADLTSSDADIQLWKCDSSRNQQWRVTDAHQLRNVDTNKCLDVAGSVEDGATLTLVKCGSALTQRYMTPYASKTWAAGTWRFRTWSGSSQWVDPAWSGRFWSGRYWSGGSWSGRYWSGGDWSGHAWSTAAWR